MKAFIVLGWLICATVSIGWYSYDCATTEGQKFHASAIWAAILFGPLALACCIGEALGQRANRR